MFQRSRSVPTLSKKRWLSAYSIIRNRQKAERIGKEYYPELTSRLTLFIDVNLSILRGDNEESKSCKRELETLVLSVLALVPKFSALEILLEANGWREKEFENTAEKPFNVLALKSSLTILYYSHVWVDYSASHAGEGYPTPRSASSSPRGKEGNLQHVKSGVGHCNVTSHNDDRLAASFCPNILHDLLTSKKEGAVSIPSSSSSPLSPQSRHNTNRAQLLEPKHIEVQGACLLADISGFTKMSATFCERGLSGLDDLHNATSGFLGKYVRIVYAHGGDVIAFAGDALLCIFIPNPKHKINLGKECTLMEQCCARAANCALALVDVYTDMLTSHVAVSCGEMQFASLGGYKNEWTFILMGEPIRLLSSCIDEASTKEVGVTKTVYDNLISALGEGKILGTETKSGNFLIHLAEDASLSTTLQLRNRFKLICRDPVEVRSMRQFVPRPVLHAIKYGTLDTISELREVITVFLKLDSYCPVKNANPATLQPFFYMAQQALFEVGGFLRQFLIDDKGCVLIAMWGVPSFTYTNNCARACAFSLAVHKGVAAIGHRCSIGITCGDVFCGNVGSLARRDFVGIGATVNLAARLMSKSKGKIYMDERVYGNVKNVLPDLKVSEGMKLKGYENLLCAHILEGNEDFEVSTRGTVQSSYVQAHIAHKVMKILARTCQTSVDLGASGNYVVPAKAKSTSVDEDSNPAPLWKCLYPPGVKQRSDQGDPRRGVSSPTPSMEQTSLSVECIVIEAQSGGGKSAIALLFSGFSSKMLMPTYTVKMKSDDKTLKHSIYKKLFPKLVKDIGAFKTETEQQVMLKNILEYCDWPGRCPVDVRVSQLGSALGLEWATGPSSADVISNSGSVKERKMSLPELLLIEGDEALALSDVMYFLLGQRPCSIIIEHSHFADELSWTDIYNLMDKPMSVAILITARVGSREEIEVGDLTGTRRRASSVSSSSVTPPAEGNSRLNRKLSILPSESSSNLNAGELGLRRKHQTHVSKHTARFTEALKVGKTRAKSLLRTSFDIDEPLKENKLAYDRAHHTESYSQLIAHPNTTKLELQPLNYDEIGMLLSVDLHWHDTDFSDGLIESIEQITFGNPYWCKEVAQFIMVRGQDEFLKDPVAALGTVVVTKVSKLTIEQQTVLKTASIIGEEFSVDILHLALPPRIAESMIDSLMYLADHNFMTRISSDPPTYGFPNNIIKGILHDLSPPRERTKINLSIAQQVEGMNGYDLEPFYEVLSWHYGRCEEDFIGKYTYYCSKSAEKALKNKNFDDLFDFANETVNVLKTHPNEEILQDIGKVLILGVASAEMTLNSSSIDNENAYIREYLDPLVELEGRVKDMLANN